MRKLCHIVQTHWHMEHVTYNPPLEQMSLYIIVVNRGSSFLSCFAE